MDALQLPLARRCEADTQPTVDVVVAWLVLVKSMLVEDLAAEYWRRAVGDGITAVEVVVAEVFCLRKPAMQQFAIQRDELCGGVAAANTGITF